jgi:hypothetical protein
MNNYSAIGIVREGKFMMLLSEQRVEGWFRLTTVPPGAVEDPDSAEIPLGEYEGSAIFVRGIAEGPWLFAAAVIEKAGPILTVVVQVLFADPVDPRVYDKVRFRR